MSTRKPSRKTARLPTRFGSFRICVVPDPAAAGTVVLTRGTSPKRGIPLVRLHSECVTGDALGSLRCDCGEQLAAALSAIQQAESGMLLYLRGQEGRGIGLVNKIRAYHLQDQGLDTVDANLALGLPVDLRDYSPAAYVLRGLGVTRIRLLTNNPAKCAALKGLGIDVVERVPLEVVPNPSNAAYLRVKAVRMGHDLSAFREAPETASPIPGSAPDGRRPSVTIHYAQTLDGRIATRTGNSQWVSGDASLRLAHRLRAEHDAVLVGVGTVLADNPKLTVRHVPGRNPVRVVLDSSLRLPVDSALLTDGAATTIVVTTRRASKAQVAAIGGAGGVVLVVPDDGEGRVDMRVALNRLRALGVRSVLIEGGSAVITSALRLGLADRLVVCIAPKLVGTGIDAVGDLGILRLTEATGFDGARFHQLGDDVIFEGRIQPDIQSRGEALWRERQAPFGFHALGP